MELQAKRDRFRGFFERLFALFEGCDGENLPISEREFKICISMVGGALVIAAAVFRLAAI